MEAGPGQKHEKNNSSKKDWDGTHIVQYLLSKPEVLSSNPNCQLKKYLISVYYLYSSDFISIIYL
jgi:hypothetical protein